ncbi:MAG TPA: DUF4091 domain-containing protein [Myxococcota bacterium]|nr:DUF4091 domain-containing protein [Myxococcota bacterium]HRY94958.1 DUF4091 domain-containing protein [Myxococcota bacterium]HSA19979.1 DUF4091 domain-containing protein [Myxococcota bacterium]
MGTRDLALTCILTCLAVQAQAAPPSVGVASGLVKLRPGDSPPPVASASLDAARNEFEPFQVWIQGGDTGVTEVSVASSDLVGPAGASIGADHVLLYREGLYQVVVPSNAEGATGPWPDPLIPARDAYFGEPRDAFPFDVPAGELRAVWAEVFVPPGAPAGRYAGALTVTGVGLPATSVPVELRVRGFALPSTATLKSAFGVRWNVCAAHLGSYEACGDPGTERFLVLYGRAALEHRVSLDSVVYYGPDGEDWSRFDAAYAPLLDGTATTRLAGARQTTLRLQTGDPAEMILWRDHFQARGWLDRLFDYTCDEPPQGCGFDEIPALAAGPHAAGLRTLVTTDIDEIEAQALAGSIDIAVPIVNYMQDRGGSNRRPDYDAFLALGPEKELWMYQSCMSHGCGDGCAPTDDAYFTGWPSLMIDASAVQNRAMEWLSFRFEVTGELYFESTYALPTAWDDQCDFSGNGDGTLFYPGTPDRIGGSEHIPIESIRLKLVREGLEDYELLHLLCELGDCAYAHQAADALFPAPYEAASVTPQQLLAARAGLADRIEELLGQTPDDGGDGGADAEDGGRDDGQDAGEEADAGPEDGDADGAGADSAGDADASLGGGCGCGAGGPGPGGLLLALGWLLSRGRSRRAGQSP